ncbi:beta-N-acetylhexosaminidase [Yinghuangia sp. YIM S10712]|uniref:beta-N-acetylhexosaminidase n=1 Tax=Yinghuangia sp. YIM S10712 TaxID=3436930 RepID=UPI003F531C08
MRTPAARLLVVIVALALFGAGVWGVVSWLTGGSSGSGGSARSSPSSTSEERLPVSASTRLSDLVPAPVRAQPAAGADWALTAKARIRTAPGSAEAARTGEYLAKLLRPATGFDLPVQKGSGGASDIALVIEPGAADGPEGYRLDIGPDGVTVRAAQPAGLFHGVQSLRQLLPPQIESPTRVTGVPWALPGGSITDRPRFAYRGLSLDIARHYFTPAEVRRFVDHLARYKFNHLHLHLTDDQGWRIAIEGRPRLTEIGAATQARGGPGGFWTQDDYRAVVAYAAEHHITVVPEIDMPGHTNAALVAYPELGCDGKTYEPYTGTQVGFSALCVESEETYAFLDQVIGQIAALTPGPYVHIGGDEAHTLSAERYAAFMDRAQQIVVRHGKRVMAWNQLADATPVPGAVVEYWRPDARDAEAVARAARVGAQVVVAPADHVYLDMAYAPGERLGTKWAGFVDVEQSYAWDPATNVPGVPEESVIGVEAALWTETVGGVADAEYLVFPRLLSAAEAAWSPRETHDWQAFRARWAAQTPRWDIAGITYARR